jgi:hypothetical protein
MAIAQRAGNKVGNNAVTVGPVSTPGFNCQTGDVIMVTITFRTGQTGLGAVISDTIGNTYIFDIEQTNGTTVDEQHLHAISIGSNTTNVVTVTASVASKFEVTAESYSGSSSIGNKSSSTGTSTGPNVTVVTQDANNWIVAGIGCPGQLVVSATAPNVVEQFGNTTGGSGGTNATGAVGDAGAFATAGSHTDTFALSSSAVWATTGIELRSVAPAAVYELVMAPYIAA